MRPDVLEEAAQSTQQLPLRVSDAVIVRTRAGTWKESMSLAGRVVFESVAGDLLATLGYEAEGLARPIPAAERLKWELHDLFRRALVLSKRAEVGPRVAGNPAPQWAVVPRHRRFSHRRRARETRSEPSHFPLPPLRLHRGYRRVKCGGLREAPGCP